MLIGYNCIKIPKILEKFYLTRLLKEITLPIRKKLSIAGPPHELATSPLE